MANLKIPNHVVRDFFPAGTGLLDTPSGVLDEKPRPFLEWCKKQGGGHNCSLAARPKECL
jgi:hypothetical protein